MEKFKEFELKDQNIQYGGEVSKTIIYNDDCVPTGLDMYDHDTGQLYNVLGSPIDYN